MDRRCESGEKNILGCMELTPGKKIKEVEGEKREREDGEVQEKRERDAIFPQS